MGILDRFSLKEKVALVTGGAGQYGRQILRAVAEAGATTYVAARNVAALEQIAAAMRGEGLDVRALQYDQADEGSILALRDAIKGDSGRIDVLVNNAVSRPAAGEGCGLAGALGECLQVNAVGLVIVTRAFGDMMAEQRRGSIINISSIYGMVGPDPTHYRGTMMSFGTPDYYFHKSGMINLTRYFAGYYGPYGVRCNSISPGGFWTDKIPEAFVQRYSDRTYLGRMANDTDLMGAVVFLASDASAYVTAANIPVDGGYTAK